MFQKLLFVSISFLVYLTAFSQDESRVNELRDKYMIALHNDEKVEEVYEIFLNVEKPNGKILAYTAALQAIMTKTTWNLFKKIGYLKKSEATFTKAINKSPENVEIRFMRMAVQYEIPPYLGYSEDIITDRDFILEHIDSFNTDQISPEISVEILGFMKRCGYFTKNQIEKFKGVLALN